MIIGLLENGLLGVILALIVILFLEKIDNLSNK